MGQEQLQKILDREDIASDVKETIKDYLLETSFPPREKLLEDNELLSAILEASPVGICLLIGSILGWTNNTMTQILGYDEDSLNGQEARILFPSNEEYSRVYQALYDVTDIIDVMKVETKWLHQDGSVINVILHGKPIDISNLGKGVIVAAMDVTERKYTEKKLKKSEKKYRELIGNLSDIVVELDSEGNFVFISPQVYEIFGYKPEEVIGKSGFEFIHPDDLETAIKTFEKVMGGESGYNFEYKAKHKDGYYVPVSVSGKMIEKDKDFKLVGVISDISERKQAEEALKKSEERYNQIIENAKDIIFTLSDDGTITSLNPAFEKLTGWSRDEIIGKSLIKMIHPEDISAAMKSLKTVMDGEVPPSTEVRIKTKSDDYLIFDGRTSLQFEDGKVTGFFGVARDITQRKQIEEKLAETEEIQRKILENTDDVILLLDLEGNHIYRNPAYYRSLGFEKEEDIPLDSSARWARIHPDDLPRVKQAQSELFTSGRVTSEYRFKHKDGHWVHRLLKGVLIYQDGKPEAILTVINDITERKQMEEELKKSEQKLKDLVNLLPQTVFETDREGNITFVNQYFLENSAYTQEEIDKGLNALQLVIPEDRERVIQNIRKTLSGERTKDNDYTAMNKDGSTYPIITYSSPIIHDKKTIGLRGIVFDISERKKAEEELRKFKTIADSAGYGVAISDIEGNLIYINDSFALMHGYNTDELIGKHLSIFHTKEQLKNVYKLAEQLKQKGSYVAEEVWHKRKDNTVFPTSMNGTLITDEKGTPQFMAATTIDITERKRSEEIRLELEQRREDFVWMTSHELRTPLTVVTGYIDFLHDNIDSIDQDQRIKIFNSIKNNLTRLEKLTIDVSTVAQFGRGIFKITISDINFCTFFQQAIEQYKNVLGNQLEFYGCQREPPLIIKGDKERLRQVIDNLVNNAIKQTHPDFRQIEVHLEIHSANVRITMKDNGAGIAPNNLEKIFEQFVSIETEYSATGTGIGLYLSRKIIEAHGGTITAQSKGLGQGTTFIIDLPITFPDN